MSCYGCGKPTDQYPPAGYFWMAGEQRTFCHGRLAQPKKPCLNKAFTRLYNEWACPVCGAQTPYGMVRGRPCSDCREIIALGRSTQGATVELQTEIISKILASFMRGSTFGSGNSDAWPFSVVTRRGDDYYSLASSLRSTLNELWDCWGALHHARGLVEGSNLLARLHAGELDLVKLQGTQEKAGEKIPSLMDDLQELVSEIVERAGKIKTWNETQEGA